MHNVAFWKSVNKKRKNSNTTVKERMSLEYTPQFKKVAIPVTEQNL